MFDRGPVKADTSFVLPGDEALVVSTADHEMPHADDDARPLPTEHEPTFGTQHSTEEREMNEGSTTAGKGSFGAGRLVLLCLLGLVIAALAPAAASASSIVYIKDGNVWLTSPDGAQNRQVTTGGNWHSPTQADDGTIAAVQGADAPITVMNGYGQVIRTIQTPTDAKVSNGGTFAARPVNLDFSPDGSKIAYEYATSSCPVASSCGARNSTFYTYADRPTPVSTFGNQYNLGNPSFVSNTRAVAFGGFGRHVNLDDLGGGDESAGVWFNDPDNMDIADGELSRQNDRLATLRDYGSDTFIQIWGVAGGNPATDDPGPLQAAYLACETTQRDENYNDPTWSPDGRQLAIGTSAGIEVLTLPTVQPGDCPGAAGTDAPLVAGGSSADWGPANVPTGKPPADGPGGDADAKCDKAQGKLAKAKAKLKKAKQSGKSAKVKSAKAKVKKAKQAVKKAC